MDSGSVTQLNQRERRLVEPDRKVTVMQITTHYNSGMQKSTSLNTQRVKPSGLATAAEGLENKSNKY